MAHEFTVESSELLVDAPIIGVRRDHVVMPGGIVAPREVVEHFGAVAVVALNERGEVAMVRQYRRSVDQRLWELPAGLLDIKDEDELVGAKRELQEEAGLAAEHWSVLVDLVTSPGFCDETVRVFLATGLTPVERMAAEGDEEADMEFEWIALDKAVNSILAGEIINSIAIAGLFAAHAVTVGGRSSRSTNAPFAIRPTALAGRRQGPDMKRG